MANRLLARYQKELSAGLTPSLPNSRAPFFVTGQNVLFGPDGVEVQNAWLRLFSTVDSHPIRGMCSVRIGDVNWLFWGTWAKLFAWDGTTIHTTATIFTGRKAETGGLPASVWSMVEVALGAEKQVWATNGVNPVQVSVDGADFVPATIEGSLGTPKFAYAEIIRSFGPRLVALNLAGAGRMIAWSDDLDITNWNEVDVNATAGEMEIRDATGDIIAAEPFGAMGMLVYCSGSVHLLFDAGPDYIIGQRRVLLGLSPTSKAAVIPVGSLHYIFGRDGIYVTDGNSVKQLDDPVIRKFIRDDLDFGALSQVVGWHNEAKQEVQWFYPTSGAAGMQGVGYRYGAQSWTTYSFELTAALGNTAFGHPIAGNTSGSILYLNPALRGGGAQPKGVPLALLPTVTLRPGFGLGGFGVGGFGGRIMEG